MDQNQSHDQINQTIINEIDTDDDLTMKYIQEPDQDQNQHQDQHKDQDRHKFDNQSELKPIILGIDLGTTNSCISIWRNGNCEIIPDEFGNKTIPSFVSYTNISKYVGNDAKNQKDINIENVFYEVKRLIGRSFNEKPVQDCKNLLSYDIVENERGCVSIRSSIRNNKEFTPEEISACVLMKLKDMATKYLKREVKDVVITVPAHFNDSQRQGTYDAAKIAGLNCVRMFHEPTAAALAYGMMDRSINKVLKARMQQKQQQQKNNNTTCSDSDSDDDSDTDEQSQNQNLINDTINESNDKITNHVITDNHCIITESQNVESSITENQNAENQITENQNVENQITENPETNNFVESDHSESSDSETNSVYTNEEEDEKIKEEDQDQSQDQDQKDDGMMILVYDFGGGTLDVSLIDVYDGCFNVQGSSGISHFGGVDFDNRLINYCITKFAKQNYGSKKLDTSSLNRVSLQKLRTQCESAKKMLSTNVSAFIVVENFHDGKNLYVKILRSDFEKLCGDLFLLCINPIDELMKECGIPIGMIDEVLLVGGMTKMPYIREMLHNKFRDSNGNSRVNCSINADEVVSVGAAIQGYIIANKEDAFSDAVTLVDVTPLSLGVEVIGGVMDVLIKRNSIIPCEKTKIYSTDTDYMESVVIKIFEGERTMTRHNIKVGEFELDKLPVSLRGIPEIEITFAIDSNGIVTVTAIELEVKEKKSIVVNTNKNGLKPHELQILIQEAKEQEAMDELDRVKKYSYYEMEDLCANIQANINNPEFKLSKKDVTDIQKEITEIFEWLKSKPYKERDLDEFDTKLQKMKRKYGVLILSGKLDKSCDMSKVKENSEHLEATTVYGKEDDEEEDEMRQAFEKVTKDELGCNGGMSDSELIEIKEMRDALMELCKTASSIICSDKINIQRDQKEEMLHHIDDIMMWYYSHEKPTKNDYKEKIDNMNAICDEFVELYDKEGKELFTSNILSGCTETNSQKLEKLALMLMTMIKNKQIPGNKAMLVLFTKKLQRYLEFIYTQKDINDNEFQTECGKHIDELNKMCDDIYNSMQGIDIRHGPVIEPIFIKTSDDNSNENNVVTSELTFITRDKDNENCDDNERKGTSILEIMRRKQNEEINELINKQIEDEMNQNNENTTDIKISGKQQDRIDDDNDEDDDILMKYM